LKAVAPSNMEPMSVTADVTHAERSWLKLVAFQNIEPMLVTAETSHAPMGTPS